MLCIISLPLSLGSGPTPSAVVVFNTTTRCFINHTSLTRSVLFCSVWNGMFSFLQAVKLILKNFATFSKLEPQTLPDDVFY